MGKYEALGAESDAFQLLDEHAHNNERWFGAKAGADETNALDTSLTPFRIDSGNNTWGTALCIVGSGDTPFETDMTHFHLDGLSVVARERATPYLVRLAWGASYAVGIADPLTFTQRLIFPGDEHNEYLVRLPRLDVGTKVFAACWNEGNTGTLDFFIGIHESPVPTI